MWEGSDVENGGVVGCFMNAAQLVGQAMEAMADRVVVRAKVRWLTALFDAPPILFCFVSEF